MPSRLSFGGWPKEKFTLENSKIVILPAPYDGTSTWIKGADKGPAALLEAQPSWSFMILKPARKSTGWNFYGRSRDRIEHAGKSDRGGQAGGGWTIDTE